MNHPTSRHRPVPRWLVPAVLTAWLLTVATAGLVPALTPPALADTSATAPQGGTAAPDDEPDEAPEDDGAETDEPPEEETEGDGPPEDEASGEPVPTDGAPEPTDDGPDRGTVVTVVAIVLLGLLVLAHLRFGGADRRPS